MLKGLHSCSRSCAAVVAAAAVLLIVGWAITLERIGYERRDAVAEAVGRNEMLAQAFEQQTLRTLQTIDQVVRMLRYQYEEHGEGLDVGRLYDTGSVLASLADAATIVDARGRIVLSNSVIGADVSDREFFVAHRDDPADRLRFSAPTRSRIADRTVVLATRRLSGADGAFRGVAVVAVRPEILTDFFRVVDLGPRGVLQIVGLDGVASARRVGTELRYGVDMRDTSLMRAAAKAPSGNFLSAGRFEGYRRFVSYRALRDYPFVVAVGTSEDDSLAESRARERNYLWGASAATLLVLFGAAAIIWGFLRQEKIEEEKRRLDASYRASFDRAPIGIAHHSLDGRFTKVNDAYCRMLGYSREELLQRTFLQVLHPEDAARALAVMRDGIFAPGRDIFRVENRHVRKDGADIWTAVAVTFVAGPSGRPEYLVAMVEDISDRKRAEQRLSESEKRYRDLVDNTSDFVWETDRDLRFTYASSSVQGLLGYEPGAVLGKRPGDFMPRDERARVLEAVRPFLAARRPFPAIEHQARDARGGLHTWEVSGVPILADDGALLGYRGISRDISQRKRAEQILTEKERRFRAIFDQAAVGIVTSSLDGTILQANARFCGMLGLERGEVAGRTFLEFTDPRDAGTSTGMARKLLEDGGESLPEFEKRYIRKDGTRLWAAVAVSLVRDAAGKPDYFIAMVQDISARKDAQEQLLHEAQYDRVTGLPSRTLFFDRLEQAIVQAQRHQKNCAVLLLDLDRFKNVNDTIGHAAGDAVLRAVGERLAGALRPGDSVARLGGDEFAVVLQDLQSPPDAAIVARKILQALEAPVCAKELEIFVTTSIGIAICPPDGDAASTLLRNADAALSQAKKSGRNMYQFYTAEMNVRAAEQLAIEADLRRALDREEFRLHYQPKVHIFSQRVVGFEALLRWKRNGSGLVSPAEFIPVLEETGLIRQVGAWVVREACRQIRAWKEAGLRPLPVAVNVSAKQFHADLPGTIEAALAEFELDPSLLLVEITESDAMLDPELAIRVVRTLSERGVRCSIDDFGTGYSSLSYLKRFQPSQLKLDRSFVKGLPESADDASITKAVIGMAHSLGMKVVAEGVETEAQRLFLQARGCDELQGYLFSKPVPAEECLRFLHRAPAPKVEA